VKVTATMRRFIAELDAATLIRNLRNLPRTVARAWNALVRLHEAAGLRPVTVLANNGRAPIRIAWQRLPASFREDVERYLTWASVPDPLAEGARARALAPLSLRLQQTHIHSAASAAAAAGVPLKQIRFLASLVAPETFRAILRHRWREDGNRLSAYTHGLAVTLIAIASEWVKAPADAVATLKAYRSTLGTLPSGLTEKNRALLRRFDDPRLIAALIQLPDRLWHAARRIWRHTVRRSSTCKPPLRSIFSSTLGCACRTYPACDSTSICTWPQGRRKPALLTFRSDETKNDAVLEFEIPTVLAERLQVYRYEIAPRVTGMRPDAVFVTFTGKPRTQAAIKVAIQKTVLRHLGVKLSPHQFRHLAAKIVLDANPGAYELVRQLLGHKNLKTTTNFYSGVDTRRAGRAHADLVMKLRESKLGRRHHRWTPGP
jgi:integrase